MPDDQKPILRLLEQLHGFASKLNDEVRQTLETMNRDYVEKSLPVDTFLKLWDARLTTWEKFLRAYMMASPLDEAGTVAAQLYFDALLRWIELLRPPAGQAPPTQNPPVVPLPFPR